jgi:AmiR/NasT family two-component response regulator
VVVLAHRLGFFFLTRVRALSSTAGATLVESAPDASLCAAIERHAPELVLLELERADLAEVAEAVQGRVVGGARLVGFLSHVREDLAEQARRAGVGEVVSKGELARRLAALLER